MNKRLIIAFFMQIFCLYPPLALAAKLAIVIDDIGYRPKEDSEIYALPQAVSVAIIPVSPYATARAEQAFRQQRDILIHLPMQPSNARQAIEAGALTVGMTPQEVGKLIETARHRVPYAIGLNNHMGSKATADKKTMAYLMQILAHHRLFFLDSKTAGNSVAYATAQQFGVKALERHFFLDDSNELADVRRQFELAVRYARQKGTAILIGHPRKHSIEVLKKGISHLPADIELVGLAQLWQGITLRPTKPFILLIEIEPALSSIPPYQIIPLLRGVPKE